MTHPVDKELFLMASTLPRKKQMQLFPKVQLLAPSFVINMYDPPESLKFNPKLFADILIIGYNL